MPRATLKPCLDCGTLTTQSRCEEHRRPAWDHQGKTAAERGYDWTWQRRRATQLANHPNCAKCGAPATNVDHITPLHEDGDRLSEHNLQSLCDKHKQQKDAEDHRARRKASRTPTDGQTPRTPTTKRKRQPQTRKTGE